MSVLRLLKEMSCSFQWEGKFKRNYSGDVRCPVIQDVRQDDHNCPALALESMKGEPLSQGKKDRSVVKRQDWETEDLRFWLCQRVSGPKSLRV